MLEKISFVESLYIVRFEVYVYVTYFFFYLLQTCVAGGSYV